MTMIIRSPAFQHEHAIPPHYTCDGSDISPPLEWSGVPSGAKSLALIVDDPDAPDPAAPRTTFVHWVLYDLPPATTHLPEGVAPEHLPDGTMHGINDWRSKNYGGPCPPIGKHRYFFKLYALDTVLPHLRHPTKAALEEAMHGHVLEHAELIGLYQRK